MRKTFPVWVLTILGVLAAVAIGADSTAPGQTSGQTGGQGGVGRAPLLLVQRARKALAAMDLSDDQRSQLQPVLDKADQDAQDMVPKLRGMAPAERYQAVIKWVGQFRQDVGAVLTPDQRQTLKDKLAASAPGNGGGAPVPLYRLQQALSKLNLNDDQKQQVAALLDSIRQRAPALRQAMQNGQDVSGQLQEMAADIRQKLGEILTPEQRQQLQASMPIIGTLPGGTGHSGTGQGGTGSPTSPTATPPKATPPPNVPIVDPQTAEKVKEKEAQIAGAPASPQGEAPAGADVGDAAPDFKLRTLDGRDVSLASLKGRTVVLEFGSYTCPSFRDRAAAMEKLRRQYSGTASFFIVYTREAHAQGEWEVARNQTAGIVIHQPADLNARRLQARAAATALHLTAPMIVDSMDDAVAKAYGGMPNAAVVIDRSGKIVGRQRWVDPSGLGALISAASAEPVTQPSF